MGQRLNIEMKNKGKIVANCYYHWSAYTRSALELTKEIISNFDDINTESGYFMVGDELYGIIE